MISVLILSGPLALAVVAIAVIRALARPFRPNWSARWPLGGPMAWWKGPPDRIGCPHGFVDWDDCPDCCH